MKTAWILVLVLGFALAVTFCSKLDFYCLLDEFKLYMGCDYFDFDQIHYIPVLAAEERDEDDLRDVEAGPEEEAIKEATERRGLWGFVF